MVDPVVSTHRSQRIHGGIYGGTTDPHRCVCAEEETGENADTPHTHYEDPPKYPCARCDCDEYRPAVPAPDPDDNLPGVILLDLPPPKPLESGSAILYAQHVTEPVLVMCMSDVDRIKDPLEDTERDDLRFLFLHNGSVRCWIVPRQPCRFEHGVESVASRLRGDTDAEVTEHELWHTVMRVLDNPESMVLLRYLRKLEEMIADLKDGGEDQVERVAWALLEALHANVPDAEKPMGWSDLDGKYQDRLRAAARAAIKAVVEK